MIINAKIALAAALVLAAGSIARANDIETNPSTAQSVREWNEYLGHGHKHMDRSGTSYDYLGSQQDDLFQPGKKNRNR